MKAKDLAAKLLENPDFEVNFMFFDEYQDFNGYRSFKNVEVADIGYSSGTYILDGKED